MNIKKVLVISFLFFISLPLSVVSSSDDMTSPLDGTWKGTITLADGRIYYDLTLKIKTEDAKTTVEAETNYAKLEVTYFDIVTLNDQTHMDMEAFEHTQDVYFNFTLLGDLNAEKDVIRGYASQIIQNRRYLASYGTFEVKKVQE